MSLLAVEKFRPTLEEVLALTAAGFERELDENMHAIADSIHKASGETSYRVRQAGADIAHLLCTAYPVPDGGELLWVNSAMIGRQERGKGLGSAMLRHAIEDTGAGYVGLNTQSVLMYASAQNVADLHPKLDGTPIPPDIEKVYQALCPSGRFPVNPGMYDGAALYAEFPDHPLAEAFYGFPGFDASQGDAFVCIGRVHPVGAQ